MKRIIAITLVIVLGCAVAFSADAAETPKYDKTAISPFDD